MVLATNALLLLTAAAMPLAGAAAETVLGIYIFHRHGDRSAKALKPTRLTPVGAEQCFSSGTWYRNRYVSSNASHQIPQVASDVVLLSQLAVTAPVNDNVLQNSASVFVSALYPPAGEASQEKLANGTVTENPLGGFQYIPVSAVEDAASSGGSEDSGWLQGNSGCGNAVVSSNNFLNSKEYTETLASTREFYQKLDPVVNGTFAKDQLTFKNGYTIFDLVNVAEIHNSSIPSSDLLTDDTLFQLRTRADQHEWGLAFNQSDTARAIAGAVLAAQIVDSLNETLANSAKKSGIKMGIQFGAYGTFMSFFGLANLTAASGDFRGVVDYASSMAFELVTNATVKQGENVDPKDVSVRFTFSNGTAADKEGGPQVFPLFGQSETVLPWSRFTDEMGKFSVGTTAQWCKACGNSTGICAASSGDSGASSSSSGGSGSGSGSGSGGGVSKPVAGVIGALVTLVVVLGVEALVMAIAGLRFVKKKGAAVGRKGAEMGQAAS